MLALRIYHLERLDQKSENDHQFADIIIKCESFRLAVAHSHIESTMHLLFR